MPGVRPDLRALASASERGRRCSGRLPAPRRVTVDGLARGHREGGQVRQVPLPRPRVQRSRQLQQAKYFHGQPEREPQQLL